MEILIIVYLVCMVLNSILMWFMVKCRKLSPSDLYAVVTCILFGPLGTFIILLSVVVAFAITVSEYIHDCFERLADYINEKRGL